jgi:micrococcal nuclease
LTLSLVLGSTVTLIVDDWDRYGRMVARVRMEDGRDLGRELVSRGLAWHYVKYSRDAALAEIERQARMARAGFWASHSPEPPSVYRQAQREHMHDHRSRRSEPRSARRSLRRCHVCQ